MYLRVVVAAPSSTSNIMISPFTSEKERTKFETACKKVLGMGIIITRHDEPVKKLRIVSPREAESVLSDLALIGQMFFGE